MCSFFCSLFFESYDSSKDPSLSGKAFDCRSRSHQFYPDWAHVLFNFFSIFFPHHVIFVNVRPADRARENSFQLQIP